MWIGDIVEWENTPIASDVIKALMVLIDNYGDLPICLDDADTGDRMEFGIVHKLPYTREEFPERFEIKNDYIFEPKGLIIKEIK